MALPQLKQTRQSRLEHLVQQLRHLEESRLKDVESLVEAHLHDQLEEAELVESATHMSMDSLSRVWANDDTPVPAKD